MARDVGEDAARELRVEEPCRADRAVEAVRAKPDGLDHAADRAVGDELAGDFGGGRDQPLREADREDAARLLHDAPHLVERDARDYARLVNQDILAVAHRLDRNRCAVARDCGAHDRVDCGIAHQRVAILNRGNVGEAFAHAFEHARIARLRPVARAGRARLEQPFGEVVDVAMIETDRGEAH